MRDQYSRLRKAGQPFDFSDTAENWEGFNQSYDIDVPQDGDNFELNKKDVVNKSDVDSMKMSKVVQNIFFDLYGTNLPTDREFEVIEELPDDIPNKIELFELLLTQIFRKMKVFEWVDTQIEDEFTAPEQLYDEVDEMVDMGETGIDEEEIDTALEDPDTIEEDQLEESSTLANLTPQERVRIAQKVEREIQATLAKRENEEMKRMGSGRQGGRNQKRSIHDAAQNNQHLFNKFGGDSYNSKETESIIAKKMQQDLSEFINEGFDVGLGSGVKRAGSGSSGSKGEGWFGMIQNGNLPTGGSMGLPTIDCDGSGI